MGGHADRPAGEPMIEFPSVDRVGVSGWDLPLPLEEQTIHVWGFTLDGETSTLERCHRCLNEEERTRAARFVRCEDQIRYVLAHGSLRALLGRYTGLDAAAVTIQSGPAGKPALAATTDCRQHLRFNLSHSHGRMLVAVASHYEVGVDLEQVRDKVEVVKLAERFYAPSERDRLIGLSGTEQARWFYRYWVAKEAVLKGQSVGLRSLQQCEILASGAAPRAEVVLSPDTTLQSGWTVHWLECEAGWAAAVSAQGRDWVIRTMTSG
jgi:4'-phosphopantetheinyl transferase